MLVIFIFLSSQSLASGFAYYMCFIKAGDS